MNQKNMMPRLQSALSTVEDLCYYAGMPWAIAASITSLPILEPLPWRPITINKCEVDIPARRLELKPHLLKDKHELNKLNTRLKMVTGDIAGMTMILEMADCEQQLLQMEKITLLHCTDPGSKKSFIEFNHDGLQQKINTLQSSLAHELMQDTFNDLFEGIESLEFTATEFMQVDTHQSPMSTRRV